MSELQDPPWPHPNLGTPQFVFPLPLPATSRLTTSCSPSSEHPEPPPPPAQGPPSPPPPLATAPGFRPTPKACRGGSPPVGLPSRGEHTPPPLSPYPHPLGPLPAPRPAMVGRGPEPHLQLRPSLGRAALPSQGRRAEPVRIGKRLSASDRQKATGPARLLPPYPPHPAPDDRRHRRRRRLPRHCRPSAASTTDAATATARSGAPDVTAARPLRETPSPAPSRRATPGSSSNWSATALPSLTSRGWRKVLQATPVSSEENGLPEIKEPTCPLPKLPNRSTPYSTPAA
nr:proline-rich receptor-like protein kinase PERK10 [Cavia porcellus]